MTADKDLFIQKNSAVAVDKKTSECATLKYTLAYSCTTPTMIRHMHAVCNAVVHKAVAQRIRAFARVHAQCVHARAVRTALNSNKIIAASSSQDEPVTTTGSSSSSSSLENICRRAL